MCLCVGGSGEGGGGAADANVTVSFSEQIECLYQLLSYEFAQVQSHFHYMVYITSWTYLILVSPNLD